MKQLKLHFKTYAEVKVFEMGIDGAVQFFFRTIQILQFKQEIPKKLVSCIFLLDVFRILNK